MTDNSEAVPVAPAVENLTLNNGDNSDFVDPWNVASGSDTGVDYDKLISKTLLFLLNDRWHCTDIRITRLI